MPNKRSRRKQGQKFYCPYCQQRLWRIGSQKYHLFYQGKSEIKERLNLTSKKASFLISKSLVYVDRESWLEEFFCEEHGHLWMRLLKQADGTLIAVPAKSNDWLQTTRTINPDFPNPSVSEFTYRMSRRTGQATLKRIFE